MPWKTFFVLCLIQGLLFTGLFSCNQKKSVKPLLPGDADWLVAWTTYKHREIRDGQHEDSIRQIHDRDFRDLKAHAVDAVDARPVTEMSASLVLEYARKYGLKLAGHVAEAPSIALVREAGFEGTCSMFSRAPVSVCPPNTQEVVRMDVKKRLNLRTMANGGVFT